MGTFVSGFQEHSAIPDFLADLPGGLDSRWVLIPWLDSGPANPDSPTIRSAVASFADEVEWTPVGLLVPGYRVAGLIAGHALFYGFDEVVVFDDKPGDVAPLPAVFTSDVSLSETARRDLLTHLETHAAVAAAGDGVGLNWFRRERIDG